MSGKHPRIVLPLAVFGLLAVVRDGHAAYVNTISFGGTFLNSTSNHDYIATGIELPVSPTVNVATNTTVNLSDQPRTNSSINIVFSVTDLGIKGNSDIIQIFYTQSSGESIVGDYGIVLFDAEGAGNAILSIDAALQMPDGWHQVNSLPDSNATFASPSVGATSGTFQIDVAVPEPSSLVLAASGALGALALARGSGRLSGRTESREKVSGTVVVPHRENPTRKGVRCKKSVSVETRCQEKRCQEPLLTTHSSSR